MTTEKEKLPSKAQEPHNGHCHCKIFLSIQYRALFVASTAGPAGASGAHAITRRFFDPVAFLNLSLFFLQQS